MQGIVDCNNQLFTSAIGNSRFYKKLFVFKFTFCDD